MKTAIVLGATGLTGDILLDKLLQDPRYDKIKVYTRSLLEVKHPKIEEYLIDLFELEQHQEQFKADDVFCCVGSTQKKTPDPETYRKVDYGIPVTAARLCRENRIDTFIVISALGADAGSKFFYNRVKGEMERDVLEQEVPRTFLLQPSLITGKRDEKRPLEDAWKQVMKAGDHLLVGPLRKYRSIHAGIIAEAMIYLANNPYSGTRVDSQDIQALGGNYKR